MAYRILIVDDQPEELEATKLYLKNILRDDKIKAEVICANNGEECRKAIQEYGTSLDLILLDANMPEENGVKVYADIKVRCQSYQIPLYLYTAAFDPNAPITKTIKIKLEGDIKDYFAFEILNKRKMRENAPTILGCLYCRDGQTNMTPEERQEYWELQKTVGKAEDLLRLTECKDPKILRFLELNARWAGKHDMAKTLQKKREDLLYRKATGEAA